MPDKLCLSRATASDQTAIFRIRHEVYAGELRQFPPNAAGVIQDPPEVQSIYLKATRRDRLVGFIGITPPTSPRYYADAYLPGKRLPAPAVDGLYELRALTVVQPARGFIAAPALMYAAFRWIQAQGGQRLMAIGHQKVETMYLRTGLEKAGPSFQCGPLECDLLTAPVHTVHEKLNRFKASLRRLEQQVEWRLDIPFYRTADVAAPN